MRRKWIRKAALALTILGAVLLFGSVYLERMLPYFIDLDEVKNKIELSILQGTGIRAEIQEISLDLTLFEGIRVLFDNNVLYDPEDIRVVDAGQVVVNIRYLPLLRQKTSLSRVAFNNIQVFIGERGFLFRIKRPDVPSRRVVLEDAKIEFNNYRILVDRYFDGVNKYLLLGEHLSLSHIHADQPLLLRGWGTGFFGPYNPDQRLGRFQLMIRAEQDLLHQPRLRWQDVHHFMLQLADVELPTLAAILKTYGVPVTATGRVGRLVFDYRGKNLPRMLRIHGRTETATRIQLQQYDFAFDPGQLQFQTQLHLNPEARLANLEKLSLQLINPDFQALVQGNIQFKAPLVTSRLDLAIRSSELPLSALELLPPLTAYQRRILESLSGDFETDLRVQGAFTNPRITGFIGLSDVSVQNPATGTLLARDLQSRLRILSPQHFRLMRLTGRVAGSLVYLEGEMDLKQERLQGHIIAPNVDLAQLESLAQLFLPNLDLLQQYDWAGHTTARLRFRGPMMKPALWGHVVFKQVRLLAQQQRVVEALTGTLRFDNQQVRLEDITGTIGRRPVNIAGWWQRDTQQVDVQATGDQLNLARLQTVIQTVAGITGRIPSWLTQFQVAGQTSFRVRLLGTLDNPRLQGRARIGQGQVTDTQTGLTASRLAGNIAFRGYDIRLEDLTGRISGIPARASGWINTNTQQLSLHAVAQAARLENIQGLVQALTPRDFPIRLRGTTDLNLLLAGPIRQPQLTGTARLNNVRLTYPPRGIQVQQLTGVLRLGAEQVILENIRGRFRGIPFAVAGTLDPTLQDYRIRLTARQVPIRRLEQLLAEFVPASAARLRQAGLQAGMANLALIISPTLPTGIGGTVALRNIVAVPTQLGIPIRIAQLQYDVGQERLNIPPSMVLVGTLPVRVRGYIQNSNYRLHLLAEHIPVAFLRDERRMLERMFSTKLPVIYNAAGALQLAATLTPNTQQATVQFMDAGASLREVKYPIYSANGTLALALGKITHIHTQNLTFRYANSPVQLALDSRGRQDIRATATGAVSPLLVGELLGSYDSPPVSVATPFHITLFGALGALAGIGQGNNLRAIATLDTTHLFSRPADEHLVAEARPKSPQSSVTTQVRLQGDTLTLLPVFLAIGGNNQLVLRGQVQHVFLPSIRQVFLRLTTVPVLNLTALGRSLGIPDAEGLSGRIQSDLIWTSTAERQHLSGYVQFNQVRSSFLMLDLLEGQVLLEGLRGILNIERFQIPGVDVAFQAIIPNVQAQLLSLEDFQLTGRQFIVSSFVSWLREVFGNRVRPLLGGILPEDRGQQDLPFEIPNGTVQLAEVILNNLILEHVTGSLQLRPDTSFSLQDVRAQAAGGRLTGSFAMAPRNNNRMVAHLMIDSMKANAVMRMLLNVSNQLFGDLSGTVYFTTEGTGPEEFLANANGTADLIVRNGRLPSVARIENLMLAASTITGTLTDLNVFNLLRLATRYDTEYFATLRGTFDIQQGIAYTNNFVIDGEHLDFMIRGGIRLVDGYANLVVRGRMDREMGGILGIVSDTLLGRLFRFSNPIRALMGLSHIGGRLNLADFSALLGVGVAVYQTVDLFRDGFKIGLHSLSGVAGVLSVIRLLRFIPPIRHVIERIPGLGYVPGFGIPLGDEGLAFETRIIGRVTDPGAIQQYRWIRDR